jgi:beta-glucosidase
METFDNDSLAGARKSTEVVKRINNAGFSWDSLSDWEEVAPLLASAAKAVSHRWTGYYTAGEAGSYEIVVQGAGENNGFRVFLDSRLLFDNWELAKAYQDHAIVELPAGAHQIVVEDVQRSHFGGRLRVAIAEEKQLVTEIARRLAGTADAVVVAVGFTRDSEGEGADRTFGLPFGQNALIREMASENKNVIVGITSGGAVDASRWIEKVPACLELWYPGEQGGKAFAEILFGLVNPSGRLPITFERNETDNPSYANYYPERGTARIVYKEGIFIGYRGYERSNINPLFPFGFGLSYTTFGFANLSVRRAGASEQGKYVASVDVTNTGKRAGAEVAQLYVSAPGGNVPRPAKELRGFVKVNLNPGETQRISIPLDTRAFAYFDAGQKQWRAPAGTYGVLVGDSSDGIRVRGEVRLDEALTEKP